MKRLLCLVLAVLLCSCTVRAKNDYDQYLANNQGTIAFQRNNKDFCYTITPNAMAHKKAIKTWMGGILNTWEVEMGPMLVSTMRSPDVARAFASLREGTGAECQWNMEIDLVTYDFIDNQAKLALRFTTTGPGGLKSSKEYYAEGQTQKGKMYWGGGFAMKNAVQQSTKSAVDQIFTQYFNELAVFVAQK